MGDKIKEIPQQILEFWGRFNAKQKAIIISAALAVVVTAVIFVVIFTRITYTEIAHYDNTADTASAKDILTEQAIAYRVADDGLTLSVDAKKVADARMALGANSVGIKSTSAYSWTWALDNSLSTTSTERTEKAKLAAQVDLSETIQETQEGVDSANIQITFADDSTSILEDEKSNTCAAMLTINDNFKKSSAKGIAAFLATSIGNTDTANVRIIDQNGNILFAGEDSSNGSSASLASASEYKADLVNNIKTQVQALLLKSSNYNDVEVAPNMEVNFDKSTHTDEHYYTDDDQETGPRKYDYTYKNENNSDSGDVPGTDANDGETTDYMTNASNASGKTNINKNEYNTSKETTITEAGAASINYENSSISIVLNRYKSYHEEDMEDELKENDQTFSEFKEANNTPTVLDVDPTIITSVAMATGISEDNISVLAYEVPLFYEKSAVSFASQVRNYLQYLLVLIIIALLLFVVFKGMKPVEVEEMEPELSVEALLATTKENQGLDDIEFSDKSASREQIEKFVDENPEAVAQLLRNWLNDDWE